MNSFEIGFGLLEITPYLIFVFLLFCATIVGTLIGLFVVLNIIKFLILKVIKWVTN